MRPNLAPGPIDSIAQYLLYLSIVVPGVLLPAEPLARFTRAFYLQGVLSEGFSSPLAAVTQAEALGAPLDLGERRNVEARRHAIALGRGGVRAQIALSDGTLAACDAALADAATV